MKRYAVFNYIFFGVLFVVGLIFYLTPNKATFSDKEGRGLAEAPELSAETIFAENSEERFTTLYDVYFSDHFPARDVLFGYAEKIRDLKGIKDEDDAFIQETDTSNLGAALTEDEPEAQEEASATEEPKNEASSQQESKEPDVEFDDGKYSGAILVCDDTAMEIIYQNKGANDKYIKAINNFSELHPDVSVNCMLIPTQAEFKMPEKFRKEENNQKNMIDYIYGSLNDDIIRVNAYGMLRRYADEYIYFRTDHHWTALGAYYAYRIFAKDNGLLPYNIDGKEKVLSEEFYGSLYHQLKSNKTSLKADQLIAYELPECKVQYASSRNGSLIDGKLILDSIGSWNKYMMFLAGDHNYVKITTNNNSGRKIIVFKESYGNAFIPFLTTNYDEIHIIDCRYGYKKTVSRIIEENEIGEALFINYITYPNVYDRVIELTNKVTQ